MEMTPKLGQYYSVPSWSFLFGWGLRGPVLQHRCHLCDSWCPPESTHGQHTRLLSHTQGAHMTVVTHSCRSPEDTDSTHDCVIHSRNFWPHTCLWMKLLPWTHSTADPDLVCSFVVSYTSHLLRWTLLIFCLITFLGWFYLFSNYVADSP